jgi:hypothetical protein
MSIKLGISLWQFVEALKRICEPKRDFITIIEKTTELVLCS